MNSKVISHAGIAINIAQVKCFKLPHYETAGKTNTIIIEFKSRYEYILNPKTGEFERQEYNETTEIPFPDYETAKVHKDELEEIWQDYLDDQE